MSRDDKFVHVSFRIRASVKVALEREAKRRNMNVNSLVNQILAKFGSFDAIAEHMEAVPLSKDFFQRVLDVMEIGEMERLGKQLGARLVKRTFAFLDLEFDVDSLIVNYFLPLSMYSRWYAFNVAGSGPNRRLIFEHPYGPKWSAFLKAYIGSIIKAATGSEPRITADDELVTVYC